jgi:hypothetical protein
MKIIVETNLLYDFHISKLNDLKIIHHLYSQYLTQTLSKTTSFTKPEEVYLFCSASIYNLFATYPCFVLQVYIFILSVHIIYSVCTNILFRV